MADRPPDPTPAHAGGLTHRARATRDGEEATNGQPDAAPATSTRPSVGTVPDPKAKLGVLAAAGIVGPILFTVGFLAQDLLRGGYDPIARQISELEASPTGWVQQVNFVLFGLLLIAFAVGLHRGVRPTRAGVVGPAILAWSGVGLVVAGFFPLRADAAGLIYDPTGVHHVNGAIFFLSIGVGLVVVSRRLAGDPRWRHLATYTLVTGIVLLAMDPFNGLLAGPGAPLYPWSGLLQRATLAVWMPCVVILALRLRRVAAPHSGRNGRTDSPRLPDPTGGRPDRDGFPGAPRWAKVLGIVGVAALVVAGILQNTLAGMGGR
ncbi:MAG: DUF998 domain-containing protein [Actinomycetota bacterium]|nr:DUF998 domain-containing protein [Actinomycetota bacterium]